jgi:excinuclease ABC subunit A
MGPGAGALGGGIVAQGRPHDVARAAGSRTASYLAEWLPAVGEGGQARPQTP